MLGNGLQRVRCKLFYPSLSRRKNRRLDIQACLNYPIGTPVLADRSSDVFSWFDH